MNQNLSKWNTGFERIPLDYLLVVINWNGIMETVCFNEGFWMFEQVFNKIRGNWVKYEGDLVIRWIENACKLDFLRMSVFFLDVTNMLLPGTNKIKFDEVSRFFKWISLIPSFFDDLSCWHLDHDRIEKALVKLGLTNFHSFFKLATWSVSTWSFTIPWDVYIAYPKIQIRAV